MITCSGWGLKGGVALDTCTGCGLRAGMALEGGLYDHMFRVRP